MTPLKLEIELQYDVSSFGANTLSSYKTLASFRAQV